MQFQSILGFPRVSLSSPIFIPDHKQHSCKKVNQYLLQSKIGQGSAGKVYLATDTNTNQNYAVKAMKIDRHQMTASSIERELQLMHQFSHHPQIITLYEVLHDKTNDVVYLVLEYGDCGSLARLIEKEYDLDDQQIAHIFHQIASCLNYLHSNGVVHQDVKPSNIILFSDGTAKLSDFGIGHHFESAEEVFGSPAYQAPEFFADDSTEIDPVKEEVWSLGVSLYETKFRQLPFNGDSVYEIANHIRAGQRVEIPSDATPELQDLLTRMLNPIPSQRLSMQQVLNHPFFRQANPSLNLPPMKKIMAHSGSLDTISASVCTPTYNFACLEHPKSWSSLLN